MAQKGETVIQPTYNHAEGFSEQLAFIELIIEQLTSTPVDYKLINSCFENPLKKKMFSFLFG